MFGIASLTDLLDGKIARKYNLVSDFGKLMDPLADKVLVTAALVCFVADPAALTPSWVVIAILAREFLVTSLRLLAAAKGVVLYLRGGGATYKLACSIPFNAKVFLAETNISESTDPELYPEMVTPRSYEGNKGINFSNGVVSDFVVEQAQAGIWYYRKWYSGMAECWCRRNVDVNVNIAWGSALYYGMATTINYPFTFSERPICQVTCEYGTDAVSLFIASSGTGTNVYATPVMLVRTDAKTVNCNILYHAHGRWK
jgi:hypothetical protein